MSKFLVILDDDAKLSLALSREFTDRGYSVICAEKIIDIPPQHFDFALLDLRLVGDFGLNAIDTIKEKSPDCKIVVLSGYGSVTTAVEAMKKGAIDYLRKPTSVDEIEAAFKGKRNLSNSEILVTPSLSEIEHDYIDHVLTQNSGNITKTAKQLGLHRQSLQRKLKKYS